VLNHKETECGYDAEKPVSSVAAILPYSVSSSSLSITASANDIYNGNIISGVENVTLWYRYSSDNATWNGTAENWWNNSWSSRKLLTINSSQVDEDLTNFPILVYESSDSDLASRAQSDGDDIVFILHSDNSTQLNHEIELYNDGTGKLIAWVNITSLSSSTDTMIWMYYGNSTCISQENINDTWDSNYISVLHFKEGTAGTAQDSTQYDSDAVPGHGDAAGSTDPDQTVSGQFGYGVDFDGLPATADGTYGGYMDIGDDSDISITGDLTITTWMNWDGRTASYDYWTGSTYSAGEWTLYHDADGTLKASRNAAGLDSGVAPPENTWFMNTFVDDGSDWYFFVNKTRTSFGSRQDGTDTGVAKRIGGRFTSPGDRSWDGTIDEFRISNIGRNQSWLNTSYNTMSNTSTFTSIGNEQNNGWQSWNDASNPDEGSPWSWSFNFPNSTGYYEFYSKANDTATNPEGRLSSADAICYYNPSVATTPTVLTNASTGVEETNATLRGFLQNNGSADTTCGLRF